jgi:hypothetical protein
MKFDIGKYVHRNYTEVKVHARKYVHTICTEMKFCTEEDVCRNCSLLGCYALWLLWFLQEPRAVTSQKTAFFIVTP